MGNTSSSSSSSDALPAGCSNSKSTVVAVTDTETGSHVLAIGGFSKISLDHGNSINSGTFTIGGHSWHISLCQEEEKRYNYRQNRPRRTKTWVSIFVNLRPPRIISSDVRARFELSLLWPNGKRIIPGRKSKGPVRLNGFQPRWGVAHFMEKRHLLSILGQADSFQVRCDVTVVADTRLESSSTTMSPSPSPSPSPSLAVPPPNLHRHLGDILESGVGADVTFDVGGELFPAHKAVVAARSPVFMAELFGGGDAMKEKATSWVRIDDVEPSVFRAVLHFVYTDTLPPKTMMEQVDTVAVAQHLLVAADKYGIERLKLMCESRLCSHIELKTVATTLALAERHGCSSLREACVKFILDNRGNLKSLMRTGDFDYLRRSCPSLVNELLAKVVT